MQSRPDLSSDDVIDALVAALSHPDFAQADRELYRQALRGLVRLAQAEQLLRMQVDFNQMTNPLALHAGVRRPSS